MELIRLKADNGNTVKVHYTGTLEDGKVFDTSEGKDPLEFKLGENKVIKGFEDAVKGMDVGEEKEVIIRPEDAYGKKDDALAQEVSRSAFGENASKIAAGMVLGLKDPSGKIINVMITKVSPSKVTLDLNHPLAGRTLKFKITVVDIT